jgi:hypothetical protein
MSKTRRYEDKLNKIDLDLTYITPRILAVSRENEIEMLSNFLMIKHASRYKVFSFTIENELRDELDERLVDSIALVDEEIPCPLIEIEHMMSRVDNHLLANPSNVAVFYCETGLKKCALMISCLLLYLGIYTTANDAMAYFFSQRLQELQIASECLSLNYIRYMHYYECSLRTADVPSYTYLLDSVRFVKVPNLSKSVSRGGCIPHIEIDEVFIQDGESAVNPIFKQIIQAGESDLQFVDSCDDTIVIDLNKYQIKIFGDIVFSFYSAEFPMFRLCFNTAFIESNFLSFEKDAIDHARNDLLCLTYHRDFKVEIFLHKVKTNVS